VFDLPLFAYSLVFAQIVLEVLPVSSTGHLKLIRLFFNVQSFAALDVLLDCVNLVSDFVVGLFFLNKTHFKLFSFKPHIIKESLASGSVFITYALCANACTALIYLLLDRYSCSSLSLIYGFAISFLLVSSSYLKDRFFDNKIESLDLKKALIIGAFQSLAICFRGVSRFGTTYVIIIFYIHYACSNFMCHFILSFFEREAGFNSRFLKRSNFVGMDYPWWGCFLRVFIVCL